jgi:hypothetical protein
LTTRRWPSSDELTNRFASWLAGENEKGLDSNPAPFSLQISAYRPPAGRILL